MLGFFIGYTTQYRMPNTDSFMGVILVTRAKTLIQAIIISPSDVLKYGNSQVIVFPWNRRA